MPIADWRKPSVQFRRSVAGGILRQFESSGRLMRRPIEERTTRSGDRVDFVGDVPICAGSSPFQHFLHYANPRPQTETVENVIYTPAGHAWHDEALIEWMSIRGPSLREVLARPSVDDADVIDEGWLLESETPNTYGDWVGDCIRALVESSDRIGKLILPSFLAQKSYVQRDLARLGIEWIGVDRPVRIARAHVLAKQIPSYYWGAAQVEAFRRRFDIYLAPAKPGSLLYLSREGVVSEAVDRTYPSQLISKLVAQLGGVVFDTRKASPEAFAELAENAETVIADQGSAIFGVLQWRTRRLIEITTEHWWHNANLFFAHASGVENYAVLVCDRYDDNALERRLFELLDLAGYGKGAPKNERTAR